MQTISVAFFAFSEQSSAFMAPSMPTRSISIQ